MVKCIRAFTKRLQGPLAGAVKSFQGRSPIHILMSLLSRVLQLKSKWKTATLDNYFPKRPKFWPSLLWTWDISCQLNLECDWLEAWPCRFLQASVPLYRPLQDAPAGCSCFRSPRYEYDQSQMVYGNPTMHTDSICIVSITFITVYYYRHY